MHGRQGRGIAGLVVACVLLCGWTISAHGAPGDTTWVHTYQQEFQNWATPHVATFAFPDTSLHYRQILMYYRLGCPGPPGDCDPWDRLGWVQVHHDTGEIDSLGQPIIEPFEIARIITPYDITGGSFPGSCTWEIDVTDYKTLLHDTVTLSSYIESWIGGIRGWLVTIDFAFIEGESFYEPYRVVNLWQNYYVVYGDPDRPHEAMLPAVDVALEAEAEIAKVRVITTGHGQGNTNNCSEFCPKLHSVVANAQSFSHTLWRSDCSQNPCSPQGGTWTFPRAGWCPGDKVDPWDVDVTSAVLPGASTTIDYDIQAYENLCRPNNPSCVSGVTCTDCNYNSTGHTEPHWSVQGQLVLYKEGDLVGVEAPGAPATFLGLDQNVPNPFNPTTLIRYEIPGGGPVTLVISDAGGRVVRRIERRHEQGGQHRVVWDGRDDDGRALPSGVYFYRLESEGRMQSRKMLLVK